MCSHARVSGCPRDPRRGASPARSRVPGTGGASPGRRDSDGPRRARPACPPWPAARRLTSPATPAPITTTSYLSSARSYPLTNRLVDSADHPTATAAGCSTRRPRGSPPAAVDCTINRLFGILAVMSNRRAAIRAGVWLAEGVCRSGQMLLRSARRSPRPRGARLPGPPPDLRELADRDVAGRALADRSGRAARASTSAC